MRGVNRDFLKAYLDEWVWRFTKGTSRFELFAETLRAIAKDFSNQTTELSGIKYYYIKIN